jgi:hypothetical protein
VKDGKKITPLAVTDSASTFSPRQPSPFIWIFQPLAVPLTTVFTSAVTSTTPVGLLESSRMGVHPVVYEVLLRRVKG